MNSNEQFNYRIASPATTIQMDRLTSTAELFTKIDDLTSVFNSTSKAIADMMTKVKVIDTTSVVKLALKDVKPIIFTECIQEKIKVAKPITANLPEGQVYTSIVPKLYDNVCFNRALLDLPNISDFYKSFPLHVIRSKRRSR